MLFALHVSWRWLVLWMVIALLLGMVVVRMDISARRESFLVQARTMHAALSRHAAQHDAMLATLALLGPDKRSGARVPAIYPQILAALRRDSGGWEQPGLEAAEAISRQARRPEPAGFNPLNRRYFLVLAADPTSHALHIDVGQLIGAGDDGAGGCWPQRRAAGTEALEKGFRYFHESFDREHAGFGGAPKFPRASNLNLLFRLAALQGVRGELGAEAIRLATSTLRAMARGGIHDHLGGGYHRYSVDAAWFVPHFEKMLYDQAQIAVNCLEARQATGDERFA